MNMLRTYLNFLHSLINKKNKARLINNSPTLICSNCTGGVIYNWLGLKFNSPFINLWMTNEDFLTAMEHFDEFIATPLREDTNASEGYPVGIGIMGVRVLFMHYKTWNEAISKWDERCTRINRNNIGIMLSNYTGLDNDILHGDGQPAILKRFCALPFKHKKIFVDKSIDGFNDAVVLHGWKPDKGNIFRTKNIITGTRYIDQFDYVSFINNLQDDL